MADIYFSAAEAAENYYNNLIGSKDQLVLAEDMDRGICVYLFDSQLTPKIMVFMNGDLKQAVTVDNLGNVQEEVQAVYDLWFRTTVIAACDADDYDIPYEYGGEDVPPDGYDPETDGVVEMEDLTDEEVIEDNELHLQDAMRDFCSEVIGCTKREFNTDYGALLPRLVDNVLELMARKFDMPIYRPMKLQAEDGSYFMSELPYDDMIFDNDDNSMLESKWERHSDGSHWCQNCNAQAQLDLNEVLDWADTGMKPWPDDKPGEYCHQCGARMTGVIAASAVKEVQTYG